MKTYKMLKYATLVAAISINLMAGQANAWTFTTSGMINSGTDNSGFFGAAESDLTGLLYTNVINLAPSFYEEQYSGTTLHFGIDRLIGTSTATNTVTINGISQTFTWDLTQNNNGDSTLQNELTQGLPGVDSAYQLQEGTIGSGRYLYSLSYVYSFTNEFNLGLSYDQNWSYNVQEGDFGETQVYSNDQIGENFNFSGTPTFIAINNVAAAVSEPETNAMMLVGLGLLGFVARRREGQKA